ALRYMEKIDSLGGAIAAIEKGYMQREIVESAYRYQKEVESKEKVIVGVNEFTTEKEEPIKILRVDPAIEERQIEKLNKIKRERNSREVKGALNKLYHATEHNENLLPIVISAVKKQATLGEICDVLRTVYGEYKAPTIF
ncbi:MAG: methylmalonyl-CoA mutase family protein, partial [Candidatus Bathyarchaeia archaeon]